MRRDLGKAKKAKAGDSLQILLSLPKSTNDARISVWSRVGDYPFSPHTHNSQSMLVIDGQPQFVSPLYVRLHEKKQSHQIEFFVEENCEFIIKQEVDTLAEPLAYARIKVYGKHTQIAKAFGRRLRNFFRSLCGKSALRVG